MANFTPNNLLCDAESCNKKTDYRCTNAEMYDEDEFFFVFLPLIVPVVIIPNKKLLFIVSQRVCARSGTWGKFFLSHCILEAIFFSWALEMIKVLLLWSIFLLRLFNCFDAHIHLQLSSIYFQQNQDIKQTRSIVCWRKE